jgi:hypothetical protein
MDQELLTTQVILISLKKQTEFLAATMEKSLYMREEKLF